MVWVHSNERWMLRFQSNSCSLHFCISTKMSSSLAIRQSTSNVSMISRRFHTTQKLPKGWRSVASLSRHFYYLRYVICSRRLEIATNVAIAIKELIDSRNVTELKSTLDRCNDFRWFAPNFDRIASPILDRLQKNQPLSFVFSKKKARCEEKSQLELDFPT